jgi:hypothetical protein
MNDNIKKSIMVNNDLPTSWLSSSKDLTPSRKKSLIELVAKIPDKHIKLLFVGAYGTLIDLLVTKYSLQSMQGVNFVDYMGDVFNTNLDLNSRTKLLFVYNVGLEKSLKPEFAAKVLKGLIAKAENNGIPIIVGTECTLSEFSKYDIEFVNSFKINKKKELEL